MTDTKHRAVVVVVNDDPSELRFVEASLMKNGIGAVCFLNAAEALEYIKHYPSPDLVITDLHMPTIDGWRFCRLLRSPEFEPANDIPVLVMSSIYSGTDVREISRDLGANGFLSIPCSEETLVDAVRDVLEGGSLVRKPLALIVEDNVLYARGVTRGMEIHGYETLVTQTGAEALRAFRERTPDVVLLDHHLRDMQGFDLLPEFKRPGTRVVVIVMTGDISTDLAVEYSLRGADAFVRKPFEMEYLVSLVSKAQRQRSLLRVEELLAERTTALRESDAKIQQAAKLASIGEMAAGVAHEINNPVTGMMNCAEILAQQLSDDDENRRFADLIHSEGERVTTIVRRLLSFARVEDTEAAFPVRIGQVITNSLELMDWQITRWSIDARIDIQEDLPPVSCRAVQLQQVIMNLLLNACDALNDRYEGTHPDKVLFLTARTGGEDLEEIMLVVKDRGVGIPQENMATLFDPFFTTKTGGTGLGLAISRAIVRDHGGTLDVESKVGEFTRFTVKLPVAADEGGEV